MPAVAQDPAEEEDDAGGHARPLWRPHLFRKGFARGSGLVRCYFSRYPRKTSAYTRLIHVDSLNVWTSEGKRGIWLKIPAAKAKLIPVALEVFLLPDPKLNSISLDSTSIMRKHSMSC